MTTNFFTTGERLITLRNGSDMRLTISERGATLVSWLAPDRYGKLADVLLGFPDSRGLASNSQPSFHRAHWQATTSDGGVSLRLASGQGQGQEGVPGNVKVQLHYQLDDEGRLSIEYEAVSDAPMPIHLSAHPSFNLNGGAASVGDHILQIDADYFLLAGADAAGLPLALPVAGTPFDFRQPAAIGPRLSWPDAQLKMAGGFDHCYRVGALSCAREGVLREVARVYDPGSGRTLQVSTTESALQFYSGNKLGGGALRTSNDGFCLGAHAGAVILGPGDVYRQTTHYRLSLQG